MATSVTIVTSFVKCVLRYPSSVVEPEFRESVAKEVARLLREAREASGLSMTQLAARAGLSHAMISFIERSLRNPTLDTLLRISVVLGVDLPELLSRAIQNANAAAPAKVRGNRR